MIRVIISLLLLIGFVGLDFALSAQANQVSQMSAYPALIFSMTAACQENHARSVRMACGLIALLSALVLAYLYLNKA